MYRTAMSLRAKFAMIRIPTDMYERHDIQSTKKRYFNEIAKKSKICVSAGP